jgi:hypothetical protein
VIDPQTSAVSTTYTSAITLTLNTGTFDASSTTSVNAVSGVAVFNSLIVDTPGPYTVTATTTGATSATGNSFTVGAAGNKCDINVDGLENVADVQLIINQALGVSAANNDLNGDHVVNVSDIQIVINAALGLGCTAV